jgi:hypothetical protein
MCEVPDIVYVVIYVKYLRGTLVGLETAEFENNVTIVVNCPHKNVAKTGEINAID